MEPLFRVDSIDIVEALVLVSLGERKACYFLAAALREL
jgi:hypothetical protein